MYRITVYASPIEDLRFLARAKRSINQGNYDEAHSALNQCTIKDDSWFEMKALCFQSASKYEKVLLALSKVRIKNDNLLALELEALNHLNIASTDRPIYESDVDNLKTAEAAFEARKYEEALRAYQLVPYHYKNEVTINDELECYLQLNQEPPDELMDRLFNFLVEAPASSFR